MFFLCYPQHVSDYDRQEWQAEQAARDAVLDKQREKERKTRERSARNARRKLERLRRTLSEKGVISDFENEFGESVVERLDQFGSAFHDREKGRPGDALSFAQKRVVAAMNKKVKDLKKSPARGENIEDAPEEYERTADRWKAKEGKARSSFRPKGKIFKPRVRHIEDDISPEPSKAVEPYIPDYNPTESRAEKPAAKKPFLRVVPDVVDVEPKEEVVKTPFLRIV